MKLAFTDEAFADLRQIGDWIASDNPRRAESFVEELIEACDASVELLRAWRLVERYERHGVRRRTLGDYLIFFRADDTQVTILRVLHGARDYEAILFPDG